MKELKKYIEPIRTFFLFFVLFVAAIIAVIIGIIIVFWPILLFRDDGALFLIVWLIGLAAALCTVIYYIEDDEKRLRALRDY